MPTVLGFDFGLARVGVAVGETEVALAQPLTVIAGEASEPRFAAIAKLIATWQPSQLVVGLPTHSDGSDQAMTARCRRFANQLHGRFRLPVALHDERFSSVEADALLGEAGHGWKKRKQHLDALAAQRILQSWFDHAPQGSHANT